MYLDVHEEKEFVQILNMPGNHWTTVSTLGCPIGVVKVHDSLNMGLKLPTSMKRTVADLMLFSGKSITIQHMHMQHQTGCSDCGLFALATTTTICNGVDSGSLHYQQRKMRDHLKRSLELKVLTPFPAKAIPSKFPYLSSLLKGCASIVSAGNQMMVDKWSNAPPAKNGITTTAVQFQPKQSRMKTHSGIAHPVREIDFSIRVSGGLLHNPGDTYEGLHMVSSNRRAYFKHRALLYRISHNAAGWHLAELE